MRLAHRITLSQEQFAVLEELLVLEPPDGVAWDLRHVGAVERGHHRKASGSLGLEHVHARVSEMHVHQPGALPAQHVLEVRLAPPTEPPLREAEDHLARSAHALRSEERRVGKECRSWWSTGQ